MWIFTAIVLIIIAMIFTPRGPRRWKTVLTRWQFWLESGSVDDCEFVERGS